MIQFKSEQDRRELLECLNDNMNEEFRATLQYICHRISAKANHEMLSESFKSAALDEMSHILFFSDLLAKCGEPVRFSPWPINQGDRLQEMLHSDISLEQNARTRYQAQLERFSVYPEISTLLKTVLDDEGEHEELFTDYLKKLK